MISPPQYESLLTSCKWGVDMENWHDKDAERVLQNLSTNVEGLSDEEVVKRREQYGRNKLKEPEKTSDILRFLAQ